MLQAKKRARFLAVITAPLESLFASFHVHVVAVHVVRAPLPFGRRGGRRRIGPGIRVHSQKTAVRNLRALGALLKEAVLGCGGDQVSVGIEKH